MQEHSQYQVNSDVLYFAPRDALQVEYQIPVQGLSRVQISSIPAQSWSSDKKLLIVDDQEFNIRAIEIIMRYQLKLDMDKIQIDEALSGARALDLLKADIEANQNQHCSYQVIFMDCQMPFMDGYQCTERIRALLASKGIKQPLILAVTGHNEQAYINRCINAGMN